MPWVGFETTIPASERAKRVHALVRAATVTDELGRLACSNSEWTSAIVDALGTKQHALNGAMQRIA
jgi:hypothetical protein